MNNYKDLNDYEIMYMISENNEEATNLLFTKYKPVVEKLAREYYRNSKNCGLELDDFIQEGYYALFCAMKKFNASKNNLFYTYAVICIKSKLHSLIIRNTTNKNLALNNSISLFDNVSDTSLSLIDVLDDKEAVLPDVEVENSQFESAIKKVIYDLKFEYGTISELKINGFSNKEIANLLDVSLTTVYTALRELKKNLLILIEKTN